MSNIVYLACSVLDLLSVRIMLNCIINKGIKFVSETNSVQCVQVEPFASLATLSRHSVPRVLLNRELVGPFQSSRCRHTDVAVSGDVVESVKVLVQGAGWGAELEGVQRRVREETGLSAGTCIYSV